MLIQLLFTAVSLILTLLFFLYGFNHYFLLNAARRYKTPALPEHSTFRPAVSVHLPIYNERYVIRRLVNACACMAEAYGKEKVKILILDDSDDETVLEVDRVAGDYKQKNFLIEVVRRGNRNGYKAGALQAALQITPQEFIAIFDADFIPPADFLLRTLPYFERNERLGIVQTRWTYFNKEDSLVTRAISHAIDVHFLIEQPGRYAAGVFQNFNGSGGVLRTRAIVDAGGWHADTLAEDLDLSYRMQTRGYRILYLRDVQSPGEIPPTIPNFKQQQGRWACGSLRVARKLLPGILRNRQLGFRQQLQAFLHLTGYMIQPLMVFTFVLSCLAAVLGVNIFPIPRVTTLIPAYSAFFTAGTGPLFLLQNLAWVSLALGIALYTFAPWISLVSTLKIQNLPLYGNLASLLVLLLLCIGISLSTLRGVGRALFTNRSWEWTRTPKYDEAQKDRDWRRSKYQMPLDRLWIMEFAFVMAGLWAIGVAVGHRNYNVLFILVPFTLSYGFVLWFSILQSRKATRGYSR